MWGRENATFYFWLKCRLVRTFTTHARGLLQCIQTFGRLPEFSFSFTPTRRARAFKPSNLSISAEHRSSSIRYRHLLDAAQPLQPNCRRRRVWRTGDQALRTWQSKTGRASSSRDCQMRLRQTLSWRVSCTLDLATIETGGVEKCITIIPSVRPSVRYSICNDTNGMPPVGYRAVAQFTQPVFPAIR